MAQGVKTPCFDCYGKTDLKLNLKVMTVLLVYK